MKEKNCFVFVVCGERPYIDSLNVALRFIRDYSSNRVCVITDSRRNSGSIDCDTVYDIATHPGLNHHQASVFLKTSVHRYLDLDSSNYCYLDSDVLMISAEADTVFSVEPEIISFGADNMTLDLFSPYAVQCGCLESARKNEEFLRTTQEAYADKLKKWNDFNRRSGGKELIEEIAKTKQESLKNLFPLLRYAFGKSCPFCHTARLGTHRYDKIKKAWVDEQGEIILQPIVSYQNYVAKETGFLYDPVQNIWHSGDRRDVCIPCCTHLHKQIETDYGIRIRPSQWQHWNGGVFVFNKRSVPFLEFWHKETLRIFSDPKWRTRDQGTLAASAWKFGLQQTACLDKGYNYIIDDHKPGLGFDIGKGFTRDHGASWDKPFMIHVYHRFGDESWDLWKQIMLNFTKHPS